jgi:hypothetical protein
MTSFPKSINRRHFLVKINKCQQAERRGKINDLFFSNPNNVFMTRNMQYGEIVMVGSAGWPSPVKETIDSNGNKTGEWIDWHASEYLPQAWIGDDLLFHHSIEGTMDDRGGGDARQAYERDKHILFEDEVDRYYMVHYSQVYGVVKKDGTIFTSPDWIFGKPYEPPKPEGVEVDEHGRELVQNESGLFLFEGYQQSDSEKLQHLDRLKKETQWLSKTNPGDDDHKKREIVESLTDKTREMERISREMNKSRLMPFIYLHGSQQFKADCGGIDLNDNWMIGYRALTDKAPELEYKDQKFSLIKTTQVFYIQKII